MHTAGFADPAKNISVLGVDPGMLVADFGAGSGAYTIAIARALRGSGRVYAVDVQKDLLRRIKTETHSRGLDSVVEIIWGDVEERGGSKIADGAVDLVLLSNLLFQLPDKRAALIEARRILKPTGRVAIIEWSDSFGGMGPHKDDVVKRDVALELVSSNGFEFVHGFAAGAHHYGLIVRQVPKSIHIQVT